jgi:hypothetical protein
LSNQYLVIGQIGRSKNVLRRGRFQQETAALCRSLSYNAGGHGKSSGREPGKSAALSVTTGFYSQLPVTAIELAQSECILGTTNGLPRWLEARNASD